MAGISSAVRWMMLKSYEGARTEEQMEAAASLAPRASSADRVTLGLLELLLPELVGAVEGVIVESGHHSGARRMASGLLTYVCNPLDIIGDDQPLGRVDDVVICALGLKRLERLGFRQSDRVVAVCELVVGCLPWLRKDVRDNIDEFITSLEADSLNAEPASRA